MRNKAERQDSLRLQWWTPVKGEREAEAWTEGASGCQAEGGPVREAPTGRRRSSSGTPTRCSLWEHLGHQQEAVGQTHSSQEGILKGQLQGHCGHSNNNEDIR